MNKEIKLANKAIFNFIKSHFLQYKSSFFDESYRRSQEKLKHLLLNRFSYCRQSSDPDQQRKNIDQFFNDVDSYLCMENTKSLSIFKMTSVDPEHEAIIKTYWSLIGLLLLDDLKRNPSIHQGGYLRGRSASGNHDSLLFLAILHRQLFGMNLTDAASSYPVTWDAWTAFMSCRFELLNKDLQDAELNLQRELWTQVFSSILDTIKVDDVKRYDKFIYQFFFNIVNPFKSVTLMGDNYKIFEVPLTITKANPTSTKGPLDTAVMNTLQQLVKKPLNELGQTLTLPSTSAALIIELKHTLKVRTAISVDTQADTPKVVSSIDENAIRTGLNLAQSMENQDSTPLDVKSKLPRVSHCYGSLYTHVPKAMQCESNAANDDCCACAIL